MSFKRSRAAFESGSDGPPHHAPFALYGTPLPAYDADARDDGSYVPVWKQEVTDERGRKRLHGAFTGGFSAGYFNTVGSKEGWAPSTFVSSRANRAKDAKDGNQQRAEDFMDEEDLAEQAESQKLETQQAFAGLGGGSGDGVRKGMFSDLFRTTGETKGMKLLQRMGWRQGQGIGPKVKRRAQGDAKGETHLFAPENTKMISFVKKNDRKGLGFAGEGKLEGSGSGAKTAMEDDDEDSGEDARILRTNRSKVAIKSKPTKKSGFGVGVLNDDGSDDDDPYSMGPRISYNRIIGADKKKKKGGLVASSTATSMVKPTFTSKKLAQRTTASSGFRKCHDGRLPLDGFVLAMSSLNLSEENHYPPPTVPADWKPAQQSANQNTSASFVSTSDAAKASDLTPAARASLLGEAALPGKSIFSYLTPAARERLANATQNRNLPPALGEKAPEGYVPDAASQTRTLWDLVPTLSKETAALALHRGKTGWMPYAEDEGKRERYVGFLELSAGLKSDLPARAQGHSRSEWSGELREFAEAAEIFRPAEGYMALRFTTGSGKTEGGSSEETEPKVGVGKEEDAAEKAAKLGMFGPLTRSKIPFYPTRLLCKRFNVKPPPNVMGQADAKDRSGGGGGSAAAGSDGQKRLDIVSQASLDRMMMEANFSKNFAKGGFEGGGEGAETPQPQVAKVEVDAEVNEALEGKRAGDDIFKAVFGSDSEDD